MSLDNQITQLEGRLLDATATLESKHNALSELCDILEGGSRDDFEVFMLKIVPILLKNLREIPISFDKSSTEQKVRYFILDVLNRFLINQSSDEQINLMLDLLLDILPRENEENGVLCMKILTVLFKSYKNLLWDKVEAFSNIITQFYNNAPELVMREFDENGDISGEDNDDQELRNNLMGDDNDQRNLLDSVSSGRPEDSKQNDDGAISGSLRPTMRSFKILSECPIAMVTLYSSYKQMTSSSLGQFTPLVMELSGIEVPQQKRARERAESEGRRFVGVVSDIKNRSIYCEFISAQIKAVSFLAYVFIRGYVPDFLQSTASSVPDLIIRLLQDCPPELSSARKELLHATRHILSTSYKTLFLRKLDYFFDEDVLVGKGFTAHEVLRPLAYSTVADFIHNIRTELSLKDIEKTIVMYSRYLLDPTLALTVQIMSAKLLLNLVERIVKLGKENIQDMPKAKKLLMTIIEVYTKRFEILNNQYSTIMDRHREYTRKKIKRIKEAHQSLKTEDISPDTVMKDIFTPKNRKNSLDVAPDTNKGEDSLSSTEHEPQISNLLDITEFSPIHLSATSLTDPIKDAFYLYRTLMSFLKSIIHDLKVFDPPSNEYTISHSKVWTSAARVFTYEEVLIFKKLFHECVNGLKFFASDHPATQSSKKKHFDITTPSIPVSTTRDDKELMEYLAFMFLQIDYATFNEIIDSEMDFFYSRMLEDSALLHIAQSFLTNELTSPNFASIIIRFLRTKLKDLGNVDFNESNVLIRLFKLAFMSVNLFPGTNELVLLPHFNDLILDSLKYATTAEEPLVYFYLIRTLFRSIGGGRFENLYRSIKPILQVLLQALNEMILTARRPHERELYVELCITVPVRLSVLAPYLPYLMRPLVYSLQGYPELIAQGLRTLELCIDNLTPEYFDPIIEPVVEDVTQALFKILKPQPFNHTLSHTAVRILGKLGGRNRRFLKPPSDLKIKDEFTTEINALFKVSGLPEKIPLSVTSCMRSAAEILESQKADINYKRSAYKYLSSVLLLFIKPSVKFPPNYVSDLRKAASIFKLEKFEIPVNNEREQLIDKDSFTNEERIFKYLLESIFYSTSVEELRNEATTLIDHLVDHFCLLQVNATLLNKRRLSSLFNIDLEPQDLSLGSDLLVSAISSSLSCYTQSVQDTAIRAINRIYDRCCLIYEKPYAFQFSLLYDLLKQFIHDCYEPEFYKKKAGITGIRTLVNNGNIPSEVLVKLQPELVAGLLFTLRDNPIIGSSSVVGDAEKLLLNVLKLSFMGITEKSLESKGIQHTLTDIICELSNPNERVRKLCQNCLDTISETTHISVVRLMDKSKSFLLSPIFAKPLRALSFTMQIGNIDAVTYCLGLPGTFMVFNEELFRLLQEVIILADAEDESLSSVQRIMGYKTSEQLVQLRVACIKLLTLALKNEKFSTSQQGDIRVKILAVFFKNMLKPSIEIIDVTYEALKSALTENSRLPKELLQNGLKPMLMNLSDYQKLTVPRLHALSKLLELLIAYFKVEIGKKLLDHLTAWCRVEVLDTIFGLDITDQTPIKIITSIVNIFYLLPPQADMFLNDLVLKIMFLEKKLRLTIDSPFREPLAKYMNRFHGSVLEYFKKNMASRQLVLFLCDIISRPEAKDLANDFENEMDGFCNFYKSHISNNKIRAVSSFANMADLIDTMSKIRGQGWLKDRMVLMGNFKDMLKLTCQIISEHDFNIDNLQLDYAIEKFQLLYLEFIRQHPEDSKLFLNLVEFVIVHKLPIFPVGDFIFENITSSEDEKYQSTLLNASLSYILGTSDVCTQVYILRNVINATLVYRGTAKNILVDVAGTTGSAGLLDHIHTKIWKCPNKFFPWDISGTYDALRYELLRLSSIFIKWAPKEIANIKKDVMKFNWKFIKLEDTLIKQATYLVASFFLKEYDFPLDFIMQVFVALLRSPQSEARHLVSQSLDILTPVIDERTKSSDIPNEWANWVKRVMFENTSSQNNTICQFLCNNYRIYFKSRELFIPTIIHHINKIAFVPNSSPDNQVLAVDLASLILKWEDMASEEKGVTSGGGDIVMDGVVPDHEEGSSVSESARISSIPLNLRETCISFLIRYICASDHRTIDTELGIRAINILSSLLSEKHWWDVNVKLSYFEKFLANLDSGSESIVYYCINTLDILYVFFKNKSNSWILENLTVIQNLLEKCIQANHHDIQEALIKILNVILKAIKSQGSVVNMEEENPSKAFVQNIVSTINQDLQGTSSVAAGVTLAWTLFVNVPESVESILPSLMKAFNKLCKDHLSFSQPTDAVMMEEAKITVRLLEKAFCLLSMNVSALGDNRRPFLSAISLLIDRSMDQQFLKKIISISRMWIFNGEVFPTVTEKTAILNKMLAFEVRGEPSLSKMVYEIVLELFEDKKFSNTEITVRMEQPFLVGTRTHDIEIRRRFMNILGDSLEKDIKERIFYVLRDQNWKHISDYPWLNQAIQLLYGSFDGEFPLSLIDVYPVSPPSQLSQFLPNTDLELANVDVKALTSFVNDHQLSLSKICEISAADVLSSTVEIMYQDTSVIRAIWVNLFPQVSKCINRNERYGFTRSLIELLSKSYHTRDLPNSDNIVAILLESVSKMPMVELPPHLVKYLGLSYRAWYQAIDLLEASLERDTMDNPKITEASQDALLELYHNLEEDDIFYGLWRRRAKYAETNVALSYEQIGLWDKAEQLYEVAQVKARSGALPFSESEYALWEDNWIHCAEMLQQWDILTELAKHESFTDLLLECGWRVADWKADREALEQSIKSVMDVPTPRRQMFETFLALQHFADTGKGDQEVRKLCGDGVQLSLHKWTSLPTRFTGAHKWLLHGFQIYLEFLEATHVYANLQSTTAQNIDFKAKEIKRVFQAWRDRLPNTWDGIDLWNDLVTWRQHLFQVVNNAYLPLIPTLQQSNSSTSINTYAYRGYHELAWIINRFAHVARKHNMPDVCINQLARIYTLPNIEIQEAFLKLREQAKCHYENPNELTTGLDVISNTNLVYFGTGQKAEFFTLKGMFLAKLGVYDEANQAFATAVQIDLNLAKAWAEWGFFNDNRLSEEPSNISYASNAISCYLQAAGLYKNPKTRNLLCRILWLISMDDTMGSLSGAFDSFRGEVPVWYWITYIPQLLTSLSHKEAHMVRQILIRVAKAYPQSLYFQLRTTREDFAVIQRRTMAVLKEKGEVSNTLPSNSPPQPWEHLQELSNILKTAHPLLTLSLESLVAQIIERFKTTTDEDLFRLINVLLIDGTYNYGRLPFPRGDAPLPPNTETNLVRLSETLLDPQIRPKFSADFIDSKPNFETYLKRLRYWRRRLQNRLDRFPKVKYLERICPSLSNFHHQKFEDIEIPGQYLLNKENNLHFVKIARFLPAVNFVRGTQSSYRRINMCGQDGSLYTFAVQSPAARHSRREERMFQLYRLLNTLLENNVEARSRSLLFNLPIAVPLSPKVRIMNDKQSFTTLHQIYDEYCFKMKIDPDDIEGFINDQLSIANDKSLSAPDMTMVKMEIFNSIQSLYIPSTVLKNYLSGQFTAFEEFWLFRKQFSLSYGSFTFMVYMMMINNRTPSKIYLDKRSGDVFTLEMLPSRYPFERVKSLLRGMELNLPMDSPIFHNNEPVPFRLTPNIQKLIGDSAIEGVYSVAIFTISRALLKPENELIRYLTLFIRDEIISWYSNLHRPIVENPQLREMVLSNVDLIVKRVSQLGHLSSTPAVTTQFVLDCINSAVNPRNLAATNVSYMAWF